MANIENVKSQLQIVDLYFSKITFENKRQLGKTILTHDMKCEHRLLENGNTSVCIKYCINSSDNGLKLYVEFTGIFRYEKTNDMSEELVNTILLTNTLAMMTPYLRSEITLLTCQPGLNPINIPPIDINKLVKEEMAEQKK